MVFQQQPELFQTLPEPFDTLGKLPAISCPGLVMHGDKEMDPDGTWHFWLKMARLSRSKLRKLR